VETASQDADGTRRGRRRSKVAAASRTSRTRGLILAAAAISFVFSVSLWFSGDTDAGLFVGIWVPSIISLGAFLIPRRAER
jgi:hypothetical protein